MLYFNKVYFFSLWVLLAILVPSGLQSQVPWENLPLANQHYRAHEYAQALEKYKPLLEYYKEEKTLMKAARCAAQVGEKKLALSVMP